MLLHHIFFKCQMGAYHTVDIEPNRKFSLTKACWDIVALERIDIACDPSQNADVAAVIMHEGLANVCLVTGAMTLVRAKIDVTIPRKRKGSTSQHEKVSNDLQFYDYHPNTYLGFLFRVYTNFTTLSCKLFYGTSTLKLRDAFCLPLQGS